jgi:hypothetical protein
MQKKRVGMDALLVAVWTYAGATWASIGHHIAGLPDLTLIAAVACGAGAFAWTFRPTGSARPEPSRVSSEESAQVR